MATSSLMGCETERARVGDRGRVKVTRGGGEGAIGVEEWCVGVEERSVSSHHEKVITGCHFATSCKNSYMTLLLHFLVHPSIPNMNRCPWSSCRRYATYTTDTLSTTLPSLSRPTSSTLARTIQLAAAHSIEADPSHPPFTSSRSLSLDIALSSLAIANTHHINLGSDSLVHLAQVSIPADSAHTRLRLDTPTFYPLSFSMLPRPHPPPSSMKLSPITPDSPSPRSNTSSSSMKWPNTAFSLPTS